MPIATPSCGGEHGAPRARRCGSRRPTARSARRGSRARRRRRAAPRRAAAAPTGAGGARRPETGTRRRRPSGAGTRRRCCRACSSRGSPARRAARCAAAGRRSAGWRSGRGSPDTSLRRPKTASASSKNSTAFAPCAAAKTRSRFFSVSPSHFETTVARSIRNSSSPRSDGEHACGQRLAGARVAGEHRDQALRAARAPAEAPLVEHELAMAQERRQRAQQHERALGQDEVLPADARRSS